MSSENSGNTNKEVAFQRLAVKRTNAVIEKLRLLGNLSNRGAYSYNEADVEKIFKAILQEVKRARTKFDNGSERKFEL